jgi:hypothetical protein
MAGGQVSVDPGALLVGAAEFQHLADALTASAQAAAAIFHTMAGAAGDGSLSGSLSSAAHSARDKIMEGSQQLTAVGQGLAAAVQNYLQAEVDTASGLEGR